MAACLVIDHLNTLLKPENFNILQLICTHRIQKVNICGLSKVPVKYPPEDTIFNEEEARVYKFYDC
jgi:hypothetical protein